MDDIVETIRTSRGPLGGGALGEHRAGGADQ